MSVYRTIGPLVLIKSDITEVSEYPKCQISALSNVMEIRHQRQANVSKQTTLLACVEVASPNGAA